MRILDRTAVMLDLEKLGIQPGILVKFRRMINKPEGMLLVTGPTGSGKTTTLYAVLKGNNFTGDKDCNGGRPCGIQYGWRESDTGKSTD